VSERSSAHFEACPSELERVDFRLRRHGRRSLRFQGALLTRTGEPGEPKLDVYETVEGAFVVAVELPGYYTDAWRFETVDDALDGLASFDPYRYLGVDLLSAIELGSSETTFSYMLFDRPATAASKLKSMVRDLLRAPAAAKD